MNISDACYLTVHDYPGGAASLGPRIGISSQVLINKVNPHQEHHKLSLSESVKLQAITGDLRILDAMASSLGCVCIPTGNLPAVGDMELLDSFMSVVRELGELSAEFQRDWADGRITPKEHDRIKQEAYEVQQSLAALMHRIDVLADTSNDKKLRAVSNE